MSVQEVASYYLKLEAERAVAGLVFFIVITIALIIILVKSIDITKKDERLVVFRFGKFLGVCPTGLNPLIPIIDRCVKFRVDRIAGWQTLSESELQEKITEVLSKDQM
jgi:regulator of protease activity HflC (stomatin/prohibitin superfamily)